MINPYCHALRSRKIKQIPNGHTAIGVTEKTELSRLSRREMLSPVKGEPRVKDVSIFPVLSLTTVPGVHGLRPGVLTSAPPLNTSAL